MAERAEARAVAARPEEELRPAEEMAEETVEEAAAELAAATKNSTRA